MLARRRSHVRLLVALVVMGGLLASGWLVLRDSRWVAVREVEVTGVSSTQRQEIRAALVAAGKEMSTLRVRTDVLEDVVAPYAVVERVTAEADVPNALRIEVTERAPVALLVSPEEAVPVAADGTLLRGTGAGAVPKLKLRRVPAGRRLTDERAMGTVRLMARAPEPLRRRAAAAFRGPRGLTVHLVDGPSVHFGSRDRLRAKWASLTAVLASRAARGATTIDVRVPEYPAAAGLEQIALQRGQPSS